MALTSVVTRLRPRSHSYQDAVEAYSSGAFDFCAEAVRLAGDAKEAALSARVLLRLGRPSEAVEVVDLAIKAQPSLSHLVMGELLTHRCAAQSRLSELADVEGLFSEARVVVFAAASAALEAEFVSREAYAHLISRDLETAHSKALAVLEINPVVGEPAYFSPIEHSRARAHDVLAFVAARREMYEQQKAHLQSALAECDRTEIRDQVFEGKLLSNLAIFAVDFGDAGYVRERFNRMADATWLAPQRYEILRSLAWSSALRGDNLGAFRDLRDAIEAANTTPRKMPAALDRAYFARQLKQDLTAREELDYAERLSSFVNWDFVAADEGELAALAFLSQELAITMPARARRLFDKYKSLKTKLPPDFLANHDRRARAEELAVDATISAAEGNSDRATALFLEAFEVWDTLGYGVRAALVARELAALGAGERFAEYAAREAALRPRSWLAASLR